MNFVDCNIVNIVASINTNIGLSLIKISEICRNSEYDPEYYHALKYKIVKPKVTVLVNKNGKIIFCGAKSLKEVKIAKRIFFKELNELGYMPQNNPIHIDNIVFLCNLNREINLNKLAIYLKDVQYDPEIFPGLFYRNKSPKFTALIFRSGKFSVTGLKEENQIPIAVEIVNEIVKN